MTNNDTLNIITKICDIINTFKVSIDFDAIIAELQKLLGMMPL